MRRPVYSNAGFRFNLKLQSVELANSLFTMHGQISDRGKGLAAQRPSFLTVLGDQWSPLANPDGIVNLGLAENVRKQPVP